MGAHPFPTALRLGLFAALLAMGSSAVACSKRSLDGDADFEAAPSAEPLVIEMVGRPFQGLVGDGDRTEDDPDLYPFGSAGVPGAEDFSFRLAQGGPFAGINVLEIGPVGQSELVFKDRGWWVRARFQLTPSELEGLQRELAEIDVFGLKARYDLSTMEDGTFWTLHLQAAGQRKEIACNNAFPPRLNGLSQFVRTRIVAPHRAALDLGESFELGASLYHPPTWTKRWP